MQQALREHVSETAAQNIEQWLTEAKYSEYKPELESMIDAGQWTELEDRFFTRLEFGTAGIRGITGIGSARISRVTIGEATQALCLHAQSVDENAKQKGIVIACDTRLTSDEFSRLAASVCAGNGFKAYLFDGFRSTPELSFAVRHLGASAGIVISASHNLPTDNGFKAYMSDGGQLVAPHDRAVIERVQAVETINIADYEQSVASGNIVLIGNAVDEAYVSAVISQSLTNVRNVSVVYSPLHGAGQRNTLPVLTQAGFDVSVVEEQMTPDGNFPSVESNKPNPEEKAANDMAVAQMMAQRADIAITNDPDADRIGVIVRQGGEAKYLSGNHSVALATEFSLSKLADANRLTRNNFIVKTIVTTDILGAIAEKYDATVYGDLLIGFKYISELLLNKEGTDEAFVIGGEESYGMLKGDYARDKDGAAGALVLAEFAAELKAQGKTLYDRLLEMYGEYGVYREQLATIVCPGARGFEQMQSIMTSLRTTPPDRVGAQAVTAVSDYRTLKKRGPDGETELACAVNGDIIVLEFGDERRRITIRPSGTEPKLKLYVQWFEAAKSQDRQAIEAQIDELDTMLVSLSKELEGLLLTV